MPKNKLFVLIMLIMMSAGLIYGCGSGGSGTASITDKQSGDIYTNPSQTPSAEEYLKGQEDFNLGNFSNSLAEFQKAYEKAASTDDRYKALTGMAWAMLKNGADAGSTDTTSIILTLEKIPAAVLYDYKTQNINDARVALALSYVSRSKNAQDFQNAVALLERIDPILVSTNNYQANKFFTYVPTLSHGLTNGEVHGMAAYLYFLQGNNTLALDHINYAVTVDPQNAKVNQIKSNLVILGLFR